MESSQGAIFVDRNIGKLPTKLDVQHVQQIDEKVNENEQMLRSRTNIFYKSFKLNYNRNQ